ncbi:MAG: prepilin peptidase [Planctomycetes bacterium]|nr:prepilin peptidase [Planctomycetota bacterium]
MPLLCQYVFVFVIGACVGSFLNVCIHRLPLEKSLLWPGSRCGHCLQPIPWQDNIPLVSYWWLRGRCRSCGQPFSIRYFLVELLTALMFLGLFYLEVVRNVHYFDPRLLNHPSYSLGPWHFTRLDVGLWMAFMGHAILASFLLAAALCDLEHQAIPLSLTVTGTIVGLVLAVLLPWPWPYTPAEAHPALRLNPGGLAVPAPWWYESVHPREGLYPWPVWGPLPRWLQPGRNWRMGLATGAAGLLAGTLMLRAVRFLFGLGLGAEYMEPLEEEAEPAPRWLGSRWLSWFQRVGGRALGLGDADLMMMAGSFLGWQLVVVAFLIGLIPGLFFGLIQLAVRGTNALAFGPSLAIGVVVTFLGWHWIGPRFQMFFFNEYFLLIVGGASGVLMLITAFALRLLKVIRS